MPKTRAADADIQTAFRALQDIVTMAIEDARKQGRDEALASIRSLVAGDGGEIPIPFKRGPGRPKGSKNKATDGTGVSSGKKRMNPWANMSPEARLARVNAIRKGRGLPLKEKL